MSSRSEDESFRKQSKFQNLMKLHERRILMTDQTKVRGSELRLAMQEMLKKSSFFLALMALLFYSNKQTTFF